jgi:hypothetical protein
MDPIEIAKRVLTRRGEGIIVPFREVGMRNADGSIGWAPRQHYCHDNVAAWIYRSPQDKAVRGYVIFDMRIFGYWKVVAHTVVETEDGTLMDITPSGASQPYPFVHHVSSDEDFATIAAAISVDVDANEVP